MEPAGDQREYRNHHASSRRATIPAMEAACNRREHTRPRPERIRGSQGPAMEPAAVRREHPIIDGDVREIDPAAMEPASDWRDYPEHPSLRVVLALAAMEPADDRRDDAANLFPGPHN
jgi:hypothetical protein